ncbi:MAG: hypothetical protein ACLPIG_09960 [Methylocella sp.]
MSIFDDLNTEYISWRTRCQEDWQTSQTFAHTFAEGFRNYIDAPRSFGPLPGGDGKPTPYVAAMKLIHGDDDTNELVEPDHPFDVIQRREDGFWSYGIRVFLEIQPRAFPKQSFGIPVDFIIDDGHCKMRITHLPDGEFDFDISTVADYTKAYDFIVSLLVNALRAKPSDQVQEKRQIGFVFPSTPAG